MNVVVYWNMQTVLDIAFKYALVELRGLMLSESVGPFIPSHLVRYIPCVFRSEF